jgi:hypothetical protein
MLVPDLAELSSLRGAVRGLSLRAHRPAMAQLQGGHRSAQRGRGLEFEEVRLYAPGDDTRNIDWRVTARRGRTHTKLFREERERPVWLVADLHAGLYFGSRRQFKSALLLRTAAILAWVAANGGDRVATRPLFCRRADARRVCCRYCKHCWKRNRKRPASPHAVACSRPLQPCVHYCSRAA